MGSSSSSFYAGGHQDDREPELGDLIEIFRGTYQHWAVYVGVGFVVHFVVDSGGSISTSTQAANGCVLKEKFFDVVEKDKWKVNNCLDRRHNPHPANVIVNKAKSMVGKKLRYDLVSYNCEHFANELRYGVAKSQQVHTAVEAALLAATAVLGSEALASVASKAGASSH